MNSTQSARFSILLAVSLTSWTTLEHSLNAADWPQWRGPDRSNFSSETGLLKTWPAEGPPLLWSLTGLGEGIASVSVAGGRLYTLGYREDGEYVFAVDAVTGQPVWATWVGPLALRESLQMRWLSQRSPTVAEDKVYTITRTGELHCLDAAQGRRLWTRSYTNDFGAKVPMFGFSDHPLVDGEKLICTPGGPEASIVALHKDTGDIIWKSVVPEAGAGAYAAMVVSELDGIRQYVTFLQKVLVGVDAKDGRLLWRYSSVSSRLNQLTPIVRGDHLFCANSFRGSDVAWLRMIPENGSVRVEEQYRKPVRLQYLQDCTAPVGGYVFSWQISPLCIDIKTGEMLWGRERGPSTGSGAVTAAEDRLYFRTSDGFVFLVEASPKTYLERGRFRIPDAVKAIGATSPVIADGRLYIRDNHRLFCYGIKEHILAQSLPEPRALVLDLAAVRSQHGAAPGSLPRPSQPRGLDAIFVPTPQDVVERMLKLAELTNADVLYDLGSGDGRFLVTAARTAGARAVGYELDRRLVEISREQVAKDGLKELVQIRHEDFFKADLSDADVVALYLPGPVLQRLLPQLQKLKPGARIVSHQFAIPNVSGQRVETLQSQEDGELHQIYSCRAPLQVDQPEEGRQ